MSRMDASEKRRIAEALILSSAEPISAAKIAEIIPYCTEAVAKDLVNELNTEYAEQDRAFEIWEVAGGFQIRTRAEFSGYLQKLQKERALRLSQAALETLAIIAYRQPTTRAEIEEVRGVDAGATVKSLLDRHLIRIAGQREVPGRPMLYGTTRRFLEVFGLERLKDLPTLRELDEIAREQGLLERAGDADRATEDVVGDGDGSGEEPAAAVPEEGMQVEAEASDEESAWGSESDESDEESAWGSESDESDGESAWGSESDESDGESAWGSESAEPADESWGGEDEASWASGADDGDGSDFEADPTDVDDDDPSA
ncbi:MAG: SMC-Scp complex subunit ScpB [Myxococcales bacterium]|nr:SMC-Scp complex subunit ScpB [Myxococcales bacterium]